MEDDLGSRVILRLMDLEERRVVCDFGTPFEFTTFLGPVPDGPYALIGSMFGDRNNEWESTLKGDSIVKDATAFLRIPFDVSADHKDSAEALTCEYAGVELWIDMAVLDRYAQLSHEIQGNPLIEWEEWMIPGAACLREGLHLTPGAMNTTTHARGGGYFMARLDVHPRRRKYSDAVREAHSWSPLVMDRAEYVEDNPLFDGFNSLARLAGLRFDSEVNTYSFTVGPTKEKGYVWTGDVIVGFSFSVSFLLHSRVGFDTRSLNRSFRIWDWVYRRSRHACLTQFSCTSCESLSTEFGGRRARVGFVSSPDAARRPSVVNTRRRWAGTRPPVVIAVFLVQLEVWVM